MITVYKIAALLGYTVEADPNGAGEWDHYYNIIADSKTEFRIHPKHVGIQQVIETFMEQNKCVAS